MVGFARAIVGSRIHCARQEFCSDLFCRTDNQRGLSVKTISLFSGPRMLLVLINIFFTLTLAIVLSASLIAPATVYPVP